MPKITVSVIKADVGSYPGHSRTHPKLLEKAAKMLKEEEGKRLSIRLSLIAAMTSN